MKTGSVTVEAAIIVPVMILVLIPFLYLMKLVLAQSILEDTMQSAVSEVCSESYILKKVDELKAARQKEKLEMGEIEDADEKEAEFDKLKKMWEEIFVAPEEEGGEDLIVTLAGQIYLKNKLMERLSDEDLIALGVSGGWAGVSFLNSRFFYREEGFGALILGEMNFSWNIPGILGDLAKGCVRREAAAFWGAKTIYDNEDEKEDKDDEEKVYRIGSGSKYHKLNCYLIDKKVISMPYQEAVGRGLTPCSICGGTGQIVYATEAGEKYHTHTCSVLFPDVNALPIETALAMGLTPCGICYGSEGYFR